MDGGAGDDISTAFIFLFCSLQLNTNVNTNAGRQRVLAVDVSGATAAEKQQRPFLPAAVAASSSLSPLPGADKGDAGMHNRIYLIKKQRISISPTKPKHSILLFL